MSKCSCCNCGKSLGLAYILCIFLGSVGVHRLYLGHLGAFLMYFFFSWTGITFFVAIYDLFRMKKLIGCNNYSCNN